MSDSLEERVQRAYQAGVDKGNREYDAIRANVDAGKLDERSPEYDYVEDLAKFSDLALFRGAIEGLRDAVLALARALDEERKPS